MSQENVESVRSVCDDLNRGEWDTMLDGATPDFEYDLSRTISPLRGVYTGLAEVRRVAEEFYGQWVAVRYDVDEFIEVGEHVVTPYTSHFRGREGIELEAQATWVWTFRDGAMARLCLHQDLDEALEAAGLGRGRRWFRRRRSK